MSRIGLQPIVVDPSVKITIEAGGVRVEGPKGKLSEVLPAGITAEMADKQLSVRRQNDTKRQRALHGLTRSLLANAVAGVSRGFTKTLEIHGVGYNAAVSGKKVQFKLGYSHPVEFAIPAGINIAVERNVITVGGCSRQQVGQVAANIRALRPPDVYKQKGIRYATETLRKKAGKTGA